MGRPCPLSALPVFHPHAHPCLYSHRIYTVAAPTSSPSSCLGLHLPSMFCCLSLASEIESTHFCFLVASGRGMGFRELSGGVCGLWGMGIPQSAGCPLGRIKLTYRLSGDVPPTSHTRTPPRSHGQRVGVAIVGLGGFIRISSAFLPVFSQQGCPLCELPE